MSDNLQKNYEDQYLPGEPTSSAAGPTPGSEREALVCPDCGSWQDSHQREFDLDCKCGGSFMATKNATKKLVERIEALQAACAAFPNTNCKHENTSNHPIVGDDILSCNDCEMRSPDGGKTWITLEEYQEKHCVPNTSQHVLEVDAPQKKMCECCDEFSEHNAGKECTVTDCDCKMFKEETCDHGIPLAESVSFKCRPCWEATLEGAMDQAESGCAAHIEAGAPFDTCKQHECRVCDALRKRASSAPLDERAEFEKWAKQSGMANHFALLNGQYLHPSLELQWIAWQARAEVRSSK